MGHTLTEKIIAKKCDRETVRAGDFINAQVDLVLVSDLLGVMAVDEFEKINKTDLFDPQKVVFTLDHNALSGILPTNLELNTSMQASRVHLSYSSQI
jgi:homoaconitase/3-isopropylmalate dehydratase large subunit